MTPEEVAFVAFTFAKFQLPDPLIMSSLAEILSEHVSSYTSSQLAEVAISTAKLGLDDQRLLVSK